MSTEQLERRRRDELRVAKEVEGEAARAEREARRELDEADYAESKLGINTGRMPELLERWDQARQRLEQVREELWRAHVAVREVAA